MIRIAALLALLCLAACARPQPAGGDLWKVLRIEQERSR